MIKTVLFDLDGTLLNTIDDLADAGNWVCTQNGWPTFTVEQFKHMVGNGIPKLVERFSPEDARSQEQLAATLAQFSARYDAHKEDKTAPYAGIPELLDTLRANGIQCAVFSNKADAFCGKIIDHYFGTGRFDAVRGSRPGVPTKPDPAGLYALMEQIHADPAATLFVGDSDVDILTGHNAHLPAMGALWGFRGRAELTAEPTPWPPCRRTSGLTFRKTTDKMTNSPRGTVHRCTRFCGGCYILSGCSFQRVHNDRTGLIQFDWVKVYTGTRVMIPGHIPCGSIVQNGQTGFKEVLVP